MMKIHERIWILAWAALSGAALLLLHQWIETLALGTARFEVIWPLYFLAVLIPLNMQMMSPHRTNPLTWIFTGCFAMVGVAITSYLGYQSFTSALDLPQRWFSFQLVKAFSTVVVCWVLLLPFIRRRVLGGRWSIGYEFVFANYSSDSMKLVVSGLFVVVFWIVLCLWALLFKSLGTMFFAHLFFNRNFVYPATALAFGIGLCLCTIKEKALTAFYRTSLGIVGWLLPVAAFIAILFLCCIPFMQSQDFWSSKVVAPFMFAVLFVFQCLVGCAYQDYQRKIDLPNWLLRFVALGIVAMPVYCALCAYSIGLKVVAHGWSVGRADLALSLLMLTIGSVGLAVVRLRKEVAWLQGAKKINVFSILACCALYLLAATPLLDPARIAVDSQVARLMTGKVSPEHFDFSYLRFWTGRYGNEKLHELASLSDHPQAERIRKFASDQIENVGPPPNRFVRPVLREMNQTEESGRPKGR